MPVVNKPDNSNRSMVHHDNAGGKIKVSVPADPEQRQSCLRSKVLEALSVIPSLNSAATFNISSIVKAVISDLNELMIKQDVSPVA